MTTVVGLGLCVVDHLYEVDRLNPVEERTRYRERRECVGGMAAGAMAQAARLGCRARLVSALADDAAGRFARRALRRARVDVSRVATSRRLSTGIAVVLVERGTGERRFLVSRRKALEARHSSLDLRGLERAKALLVDGHFERDALRAARIASERGIPVVGDFTRASPAVRRLLPYVSHPIVPESFVEDFAAGSLRETLLKLAGDHGATPIVTQGARGGAYLEGRRLRRFAAVRARVRDTTGAGDAFHGAFLAGLAQGLGFERNLARAARCGAAVTRHLGGPAAFGPVET